VNACPSRWIKVSWLRTEENGIVVESKEGNGGASVSVSVSMTVVLRGCEGDEATVSGSGADPRRCRR